MLIPQRNNSGEELSTSGSDMSQKIGLGWHLVGRWRDPLPVTILVEEQGTGASYVSIPSLSYGICVMGNETSYDTGAVTRMLAFGTSKAHELRNEVAEELILI